MDGSSPNAELSSSLTTVWLYKRGSKRSDERTWNSILIFMQNVNPCYAHYLASEGFKSPSETKVQGNNSFDFSSNVQTLVFNAFVVTLISSLGRWLSCEP